MSTRLNRSLVACDRSRTGTVVLGLMLICLLAAQPAAAFDVGGLVQLDGTAASSDDFPDNVVLVFFSTWSPKCRSVVERTNRLQRKWGQKAEIVLVNFQEDRAAVEKFIAGKRLGAQVLLDPGGAFSKKHGITYLPSLLAIKNDETAFRGRFPADPSPLLEPIYE